MRAESGPAASRTAGTISISVIVPAFNNSRMLAKCLAAIAASDLRARECLVADDGSTEDIGQVADALDARVIRVGDHPQGPAFARNAGAAAATGDVLLFVDADVVIRPDTLRQFAEAFSSQPAVDAVFGSYDDAPATPDFVSQFKNLFHHFVHQQASEEAGTFWSGCGAVRRAVFRASGGFDAKRYPRPCIEDIELGSRLRAAGHRILLDRRIMVKHLKRWTLGGMIKTDIFDRGVPWTRLILESQHLPNDLNLRVIQRVSALLAAAMLLYVALMSFVHGVVLLPLMAGLVLIVVSPMNWSNGGPLFSERSWALRLASYAVPGVIAGLAVAFGYSAVVPPLVLLLLVMLASHWAPSVGPGGARALFGLVLGALAASTGAVLVSLSPVLTVPLLLAAGLIVILNYPLYGFFVQRRGVLFALAAVPMHLLYFLCTLVALTIGVLAFLTGGRRQPAAA